MIPLKKSRYHHHPRSDWENGYRRKPDRPARAGDLPSTFFGTVIARRGGFFEIGGRFRCELIDFVLKDSNSSWQHSDSESKGCFVRTRW
jgi:hypothetical protein